MSSPKRAASGMLAGCTSSIAVAQHAVADQASMLRLFLRDPRLRAPALAIWVASFGGALHEPVTAFFMVELGATTAQMGNFGAIRTVGAWTLGPAYGWLIDRYTAFLPTILSAFICATGCCLRGFTPAGRTDLLYASAVVLGLGAANFWNVVGTHLACATDRDLRPLVVSAYFVQVNTLELLGKLVYPLWDAALHLSPLLAADRLLRFRVTMSVCSFFCVFGVGNLLFNGQPMKEVNCHDEVAEEEEATGTDQTDDVVPNTSASSIGSAASSDSTKSKTASVKKRKKSSAVGDPVAFLAVCTVLICLAAGLTAVKTLWPLYVRLQFEWEDHAYARISLAGSLASILGACLMPAAAKRVGAPVVAIVLCAAACIGVISGFPAEAMAATHIGGALLFMSAASALRPCLEALASLAVAPRLQGRVFAFLKLADAFGQMLGSYAGTRLYDISTSRRRPLADAAALLPMHGGAMPFVLIGAALLVSTTALAVALLPAGGAKHSAAGGASASSSSEGASAAVGMDAFVNSGNTVTIEAEHELANLLHRSARVAKCSVAE